MKFIATLASAILLGVTATIATAATYNIVGSFSGGQLGEVDYDFTVSLDLAVDSGQTSVGLAVNSLTSSVLGDFVTTSPLQFEYFSVFGDLYIGGGSVFSVRGDQTDFLLGIHDFPHSPFAFVDVDSSVYETSLSIDVQNTAITITEVPVSTVPLPSGGALIIAGVGCMAAFRRRKLRVGNVAS